MGLWDEVSSGLISGKTSNNNDPFSSFFGLETVANAKNTVNRNTIQKTQTKNALKNYFDNIFYQEALKELLSDFDKSNTKINDKLYSFVNSNLDKLNNNQNCSEDIIDKIKWIYLAKYNREIIDYTFNKFIKSWENNLNSIKIQLANLVDKNQKQDLILKRLQQNLEKGLDLTDSELEQHDELVQKLPIQKSEERQLIQKIRITESIVYASHGLLQSMQDENKLKDRADLMQQIPNVGNIIFNCMIGDYEWNNLTIEQQNLVINFSIIYV